ncbi:MAG: hypothetical protein ACE5JG_03810, partial [Planctomycetota bacterium]
MDRPGRGVGIAVAAVATLALASLAHAGDTPVVVACDPADRVSAKLGRDGLVRALELDDGAILAVTGGALASGGAPKDAAETYAPAMLDAAGFDVVNLAHRDLAGDADRLAAALAAAKVRFISATFRMAEGKPTPWKRSVIVRGTAFLGVAGRSASMDLPGSGAIEGLRFTEPGRAIREVLPDL